MYHIEVASFEKLVKKIKKHPLKKDIIADIQELQTNPAKGKFLPKHQKYELKYPNLRIYYIVEDGLIVVCGQEYDGLIVIDGKGNKNQQKRTLGK